MYALELTSFCRRGLQLTPATCYGFCHHQQSGSNKHCTTHRNNLKLIIDTYVYIYISHMKLLPLYACTCYLVHNQFIVILTGCLATLYSYNWRNRSTEFDQDAVLLFLTSQKSLNIILLQHEFNRYVQHSAVSWRLLCIFFDDW